MIQQAPRGTLQITRAAPAWRQGLCPKNLPCTTSAATALLGLNLRSAHLPHQHVFSRSTQATFTLTGTKVACQVLLLAWVSDLETMA